MQLATDKQGDYPVIWEWMNRKTRLPWSSDLRTMATMRSDGTIAAAVGFNCWSDSACWMHVAFDNPQSLTRQLLKNAFEYPFIQCGKDAVYGLIYKNNDEALNLVKRLGYREIAQTVDSVMFEMLYSECRWIKTKETEEVNHG
jgi:hypothetical protein